MRAQIAEKECKKEEARQRKALEERQEEERIAKQIEKLQREYQEEQERIRRKEVGSLVCARAQTHAATFECSFIQVTFISRIFAIHIPYVH